MVRFALDRRPKELSDTATVRRVVRVSWFFQGFPYQGIITSGEDNRCGGVWSSVRWARKKAGGRSEDLIGDAALSQERKTEVSVTHKQRS